MLRNLFLILPFACGGLAAFVFAHRLRATEHDTPLARLGEIERRAEHALGGLRATTDTSEVPVAYRQASSILQQLAWARSIVGDYGGAIDAFSRANNPLGELVSPKPVGPEQVAATLEGYRPIDAIAAIVNAARSRQIVILNEAHHISRHRAFALQLARELRKLGFQYLACEGFSALLDSETLQRRGYPTKADGLYLAEPLFADFVRESLRLGFIPIAYEHVSGISSTRTRGDSINQREAGQAVNLMERVFKRDPKAQVFIYCGFSHLKKQAQSSTNEPGVTLEWMARRLQALTGIEPVTIDQTTMTDPQPGTLSAAALARAFAEAKLAADSVVLRNDSGGHLVLGTYKGDADLQVWHRTTRWERGRPHWLTAGDYRKLHPIPTELLPAAGRRLVQAFRVGEGDDAVAVDQIIVRAGEEPPVLMLPDGEHRFVVED